MPTAPMHAKASCMPIPRPSFLPLSGAPSTTGHRFRLLIVARAAGQWEREPLSRQRGSEAGTQQRSREAPGRAPQSQPPGELRYYVTCHPGLEEVVASELRGPHIRAAQVRPGKAGVSFVGDAATGYRANMWLRSAIRVLQFLAEAELDPRKPGGDEVYRAVRELLPWPSLLLPGQSFSVEARLRSCAGLTSSQLLVVRAKDAICDHIRDRRGTKPAPPEPGRIADLPLYCTAFQERLTVFRDLSGASLHRRGYRGAMHRASLNESAAAGILCLAGWDTLCMEGGDAALADPMCGSGTLLIEAALMASCTAPGLFRRWWPLQAWPDTDRRAWAEAVREAVDARRAPAPGVALWGNDMHPGALALAQRDAEAARVGSAVRLHQGGCREWVLPSPPRLVVSNPPWGQRLLGMGGFGEEPSRGRGAAEGGPEVDEWWEAAPASSGGAEAEGGAGVWGDSQAGQGALAAAWRDLSVFLKEQCGGAEACLLSGSAEATQHLRLRADKKWPLSIGGVDCRLLKYSIRGRAAGGSPGASAGAATGAGAAARI